MALKTMCAALLLAGVFAGEGYFGGLEVSRLLGIVANG